MDNSRTVAVVDDDDSVRVSLDALLRSAGWRVRAFSLAEEFLLSGAASEAACLLADVNMPGMAGPELCGELVRRGHLSLPVILLTGHLDDSVRERTLAAGAGRVLFFPKPFDEDALLECLERAAAAGKA